MRLARTGFKLSIDFLFEANSREAAQGCLLVPIESLDPLGGPAFMPRGALWRHSGSSTGIPVLISGRYCEARSSMTCCLAVILVDQTRDNERWRSSASQEVRFVTVDAGRCRSLSSADSCCLLLPGTPPTHVGHGCSELR